MRTCTPDRQIVYVDRMRAGWLSVVVVGWLATAATGEPAARQRVVLADLDPELRHAMEQSLAPWHLQVVVEATAPEDTAAAQQRADINTARFVVWRDADQLVVYDRELGSLERRASRNGVLDPPTAAAAALTIKTMMRLPPPADEPVALAARPAPVAAEPGSMVRLQAGLSTRVARGDTTAVSARLHGTATLRPWPAWGWRFGISGDGGSSTSVSRAGFKGAWSEWSLAAVAGWASVRGAWEIEPDVNLGLRRSKLDGTEMSAARTETATLMAVRGGLWVYRRHAPWTFGIGIHGDATLGAPTYTKLGAAAEIFRVPGVAVELGLGVGLDL